MTKTLRPYQVDGVRHLRAPWTWPEGYPRISLLCDEMGLGKTPQGVMALPGPLHDEPDVCTCILAPSGLLSTWRRHIEDWRPDIKAKVVRRTQDIRAPHYGEAVIVSADAIGWATGATERRAKRKTRGRADHEAASALTRMRSGLLADPSKTVFIVDEAHIIKGSTSLRARAVGNLIRPCVARGATAWALTATPTPRSAADAWSLIHRLGGENHPLAWRGKSLAGWQAWAKARGKSPKWRFLGEPDITLEQALGGIMLRRLVRDHLPEIPPPVHSIRLVTIGDDLRSEADKILGEACKSIGVDRRKIQHDGVGDGDELDEALLRGLSATVNRGELATLSAKLAAVKMPHVLAELQAQLDAGEATIVYSEHRVTIEAMAKHRHPVVVGGMTESAKRKAVALFQDGHAQALGFTGAGRQGLDMTRAATFIEADTNWSSDDRAQAIGRALRFGREDELSASHFLADHPLEFLKMRVLRRKRKFTLATLGSSL